MTCWAGMWELIGSLGAVPRRLNWDNETDIGRRNSDAAGVSAFAGVLATRIVQVKPYGPGKQGRGGAGPTSSYRPRSCPAGPSYRRRISMPNSAGGFPLPMPVWSGGPGPDLRS